MSVKKEHQCHFSGQCFWPNFCASTSMKTTYWLVCDNGTMIYHPQLCGWETCSPLFESERDSFCKRRRMQHIVQQSAYVISSERIFFDISVFFCNDFWTQPYTTFTWYTTIITLNDCINFVFEYFVCDRNQSFWTTFIDNILATTFEFSVPFSHMLNTDCGFTINVLNPSINFNRWKVFVH